MSDNPLFDNMLKRFADSDEYKRMQRRRAIAERLFGWTRSIPLVGSLVWVFWSTIVDEGPYATMKPRWGALTFSFLNDGMGATVWHTWRSITHDQDDSFTGVYVAGAPRNHSEALEIERRGLTGRKRL